MAWSPEQISHRLRVDFPEDESMRISHEAIYQSLFIEGRGALKRELVACLRTGRALREPRARSRNKPQGHVTADVVLSERPAEAADRTMPGHWEGGLINGTGRSAIGTLVERSSRSTILAHLPRLEGWAQKPPERNSPSLGGYGAAAMNAALMASVTRLPEQLRRTLTWDRGKELSGHAQFTLETGTKVFFADPHSPWQRPTNENTNGLLRQYFPKGTDLARWSAEDLEAVALAINNRPRKILGWKTPARYSASSYARYNSPVLQRPVELAQYTSFAFTASLLDAGIDASIGTVGDALGCQSFRTGSRKDRVVPAEAVWLLLMTDPVSVLALICRPPARPLATFRGRTNPPHLAYRPRPASHPGDRPDARLPALAPLAPRQPPPSAGYPPHLSRRHDGRPRRRRNLGTGLGDSSLNGPPPTRPDPPRAGGQRRASPRASRLVNSEIASGEGLK
jgi:IS30 family transposase